MSYQPGGINFAPTMVMAWGYWSSDWANTGFNPASGAWESANRAVYAPIVVPQQTVLKRFWWTNGATVGTAYSIEAGLYADAAGAPGAKIVTTGSVTQGTANRIQFADVTDTVVAPGRYWLYLSCSSTSATIHRNTNLSVGVTKLIRFEQDSVGPGSAPATATPATSTANNQPVFGFSTTATP